MTNFQRKRSERSGAHDFVGVRVPTRGAAPQARAPLPPHTWRLRSESLSFAFQFFPVWVSRGSSVGASGPVETSQQRVLLVPG